MSGVSELRHLPLFDGLTDDQLDRLLHLAARDRLDTHVLVVVRHAKAGPRGGWNGPDGERRGEGMRVFAWADTPTPPPITMPSISAM